MGVWLFHGGPWWHRFQAGRPGPGRQFRSQATDRGFCGAVPFFPSRRLEAFRSFPPWAALLITRDFRAGPLLPGLDPSCQGCRERLVMSLSVLDLSRLELASWTGDWFHHLAVPVRRWNHPRWAPCAALVLPPVPHDDDDRPPPCGHPGCGWCRRPKLQVPVSWRGPGAGNWRLLHLRVYASMAMLSIRSTIHRMWTAFSGPVVDARVLS